MQIRPRRDGDLPALVEHLRATHARDAYPVRPQNVRAGWLTEHRGPAWVADDGGAAVGHVALDVPPEEGAPAEVVRLFLAPAARGRGLATALLDHATAHARAAGRDIVLQVMAHNADAVALYERRGWRRTGQEDAAWAAEAGLPQVTTYWYAPPA
ncbi:GNAT family N-acetyltransferase [Puerhibacterium puerhi]|uniref:GNAT family N-acetyltransferase n=1 Tax=Puerhibacterium puerhi TaxID=2692623 RepID=UPI00135B9FE2|nr:GNAT family N-acetyltransferase [Puerhibacterium puerhi]